MRGNVPQKSVRPGLLPIRFVRHAAPDRPPRRPRPQRANVRARARLGQPEGAELASLGERPQPPLALVVVGFLAGEVLCPVIIANAPGFSVRPLVLLLSLVLLAGALLLLATFAPERRPAAP